MAYATERDKAGREPIHFCELDMDICSRAYEPTDKTTNEYNPNLLKQSETFLSIPWYYAGNITVTEDTTLTKPARVSRVYRIIDAGIGAPDSLYQILPAAMLTDNAGCILNFYVHFGNSVAFTISLYDNIAAAYRSKIDFNAGVGGISIKANDVGTGFVQDMGDSWYRCSAIVPINQIISANTHMIEFRPTEEGVVEGSPFHTYASGAMLEGSTAYYEYMVTLARDGSQTNIRVVEQDDPYTVLLLHCDGVDGSTAFPDASPSAHVITAEADAQVDTAQQKFGTGSMLLDGVGDYVWAADHDDWNFGAGDFTIDMWVRFSSVAVYRAFCSQSASGTRYWFFRWRQATAKLQFQLLNGADTISIEAAWAPAINIDYHIAVVRNGNNWYFFVNGVSLVVTGSPDASVMPNFAGQLHIGRFTTQYMAGWIDEFRISKGIARWTANFTPPIVAYDPLPEQLVIDEWIGKGVLHRRNDT